MKILNKLETVMSTASSAGLNLPHGTTPTSPVDGDVWSTTAGLHYRANGTTRTIAHADQWSLVSQAEAEEGTSSSSRLWSAQRVSQAISASAPTKVNLGGQIQRDSYRKSVIALCQLDLGAANTSISQGTLTIARANGLFNPIAVDVNMMKRYNANDMFVNYLTRGHSKGIAGITPCTFTYNGVKYGGLHVYIDNASFEVCNFVGYTNFSIFGLDYLSVANGTNTVLEQEIYNTLNFVEPKLNEGTISFNGESFATIGETETTAYRGDRGKTAYDHSQAAHAPSNAQKNSDITKAEIEAKLTGNITSHNHDNSYSDKGLRTNNYIRITVDGDANKYYPVVINDGSSSFAPCHIGISRSYGWAAPNTWYSATHKGGLTLGILWTGDTYWGGNNANMYQVTMFSETYSTMVGGLQVTTSGLVVWLRGGTALYQIESDYGTSTTATVYLDGYTDASSRKFEARSDTSRVENEILTRYSVRIGEVYDTNNRVYSPVNKPTPSEIGASAEGHTHNVATTSTEGLMSASDKTKLNNIAAGANNYVHPSSHPASIIAQDASNRFVTDVEKSTWNAKASTAVATTNANGLMSAADKKIVDSLSLSPSTQTSHNGYVDPLFYALRHGKQKYTDEEFATSTNSVSVYNNSGGSGVVISRVAMSNAPNNSGYVLQVTHNGSTTSPNLGGIIHTINSRANAVIVNLFKAKLPVGYSFVTASNSMGNNSRDIFVGSNVGTGKWETYIRMTMCGDSGTFSSGGHISVTGAKPTSAAPLVWHIASATQFDLTDLGTGMVQVSATQPSNAPQGTFWLQPK